MQQFTKQTSETIMFKTKLSESQGITVSQTNMGLNIIMAFAEETECKIKLWEHIFMCLHLFSCSSETEKENI